MTKRVSISAAGIRIARPGYDVDTATEAQLLFSPIGSIQGLYMTGTVVLSATTMPTVPSSAGSNRYRYAEVLYGKTFAVAPLVYACGIDTVNSQRDCSTMVTFLSAATLFYEPNFVIYSQVDRFKIWAKANLATNWSLNLNTWRYFVLENGL